MPSSHPAIERARINALFERLPGSIVAMLIGVLLTFVFLYATARPEFIKAWAAYMLSTLALRTWLWYQFRTSLIADGDMARWEWIYAGGMALTALGWTALCGPLFPAERSLQDFVWVMMIVIAYSGMVLAAPSRIAFVLFIVPTMVPGLWRYIDIAGGSLLTWSAGAACLGVLVVTHHSLYKLFVEHVRRQVIAEQLLAEQEAIFRSATIAIVVLDGNTLIKCNPRFGDLFGRDLQSSLRLSAVELFALPDEGEKFLAWAEGEFAFGRAVHSMERLRRADGSQFWAEISGRPMRYGSVLRNLWLVSEATVQQNRQAASRLSAGEQQSFKR